MRSQTHASKRAYIANTMKTYLPLQKDDHGEFVPMRPRLSSQHLTYREFSLASHLIRKPRHSSTGKSHLDSTHYSHT